MDLTDSKHLCKRENLTKEVLENMTVSLCLFLFKNWKKLKLKQ